MNWRRPYVVFCLVVLGVFAWARYEGRSIGDTLPHYGRSGSGGGGGGGSGGIFYTGTSGGSHK